MEITVPAEYPYVLGAISLLCIECFLIGFSMLSVRQRVFTKEHMKQFEEDHAAAFPDGKNPLEHLGNPDNGDGRYSQKLDYKSWFEFNEANRTH